MSDERKSVIDWAIEYAGDPGSFDSRGKRLLEFLVAEGATQTSRILEIGCGPLTLGLHAIRYLGDGPGFYCGVDPNGWQVEAALNEFYGGNEPAGASFLYRTDFDATSEGPFDYVIAHSVLSHVADWQLDLCLSNVRKAVTGGAVFLASLRIGEHDSYHQSWQYPGVSYFTPETVIARGHHFGWDARPVAELRQRMMEVAKNDSHDWFRFRATYTADEFNNIRLEAERATTFARGQSEMQQHEYEERRRQEVKES